MGDISIEEARKAMIAKRFGGNVAGAKLGGTGSQRRKNKGTHKSGGDDKKLGGMLKKMNMTPINGIEEVNIFRETGEVIHITSPKIQASVPCNTYVISGNVETKPIQSFMPAIVPQLSQEMMNEIGGGMQSGAGPEEEEEEEDDDEDIPELVENFEDASKK